MFLNVNKVCYDIHSLLTDVPTAPTDPPRVTTVLTSPKPSIVTTRRPDETTTRRTTKRDGRLLKFAVFYFPDLIYDRERYCRSTLILF